MYISSGNVLIVSRAHLQHCLLSNEISFIRNNGMILGQCWLNVGEAGRAVTQHSAG